jgi:hypothetical protein
MSIRLPILLFLLTAGLTLHAQPAAPRSDIPPFPSPEVFLNAVFHTVVDPSFDHYYLITGTDTCRFVKYDYDEWIKYNLKEAVPFTTLNELSEKAYLSRYPYYWRQKLLEKAICITPKKADSLLFPERYAGAAVRESSITPARETSKTPLSEKLIFSFSLPQFTDDGKFAVIDLNSICGANCGLSLTCLFKQETSGWRLIGRHVNWSSAVSTSP